jgi:phage shock protein PspC (stress-responsive transcriptional regulator)
VTDLKRLGKPNSYRLGRLRAQGVAQAAPPAPFRPRFTRPRHRGPVLLWLLAAAAGAAAIAAGAVAGIWFVPFIAGVVAGLANRYGAWRARVTVTAAVLMAVVGWGVPLGWMALHGRVTVAVARGAATVVGLPAHASIGVALTLLVAVAQAVAGLWLGRALTPQPGRD